ncbi:tetratricopeptide repeat-containing sensor histidine kinase [Chryseobacterium echinoideorum]|uniref:tetratricopeptide repeat-containing sensor histidine kinase n=1 Tax=Chryseobacterium echinoideorum TaxID=1549648 RepID=UPI001186957D|nr:tetratricopeptide repeat protein [Chryseobacterium echinoideorum]
MKNLLIIITLCLMFSCKKENIAKSDPPTNRDFEKARMFSKNGSTNSAFYYFNLSKNDFLDKNDSLGAARALVNMALIQTNNGDFFGGIESSLETNKFLKSEQGIIAKKILTSNYNNIANASNSLRNYDRAIVYYKKAIQSADNNEAKYICYNNIGDALINQGKIKLAKIYLKKAILADSAINYSRALNNFAKAMYLDEKNYNPLPDFNKALAIRQKIKDGAGLNSSYETLSTYYFNKDKKVSLQYAKKMLKEAIHNNSPDDQITALKRIISLEPENYLQNFEKLDSISENVQTSRNKHKSQFAIVRYDVEQKDAENKNLKLQKLEDENKILILFGTLALSVLVIVFLRKRQIRLKQEKELEVKNTELKYSKKVHDVVANGLYHLMIDIDNNPEINKVKILNDIEKMYEESRDISHENTAENDFSMRFIHMITSYSSDEQKVLSVGYKENIWDNISYNTQLEIYYILREILVNMKKHSQAKLASVKFEKHDDNLKIKYTDNGIGIHDLDQQKGTGIHNTENRIASIGGDITFEKNPTGGLIIRITIPIQKYV